LEGLVTQITVGLRVFVVFMMTLAAAATGALAQDAKPLEVALGAEDAPVTVVEYMSLTCPHCANFHNTVLPDVMKAYVDTGKVRMVFRDYPLDGVAYRAAIVSHCMAESGPKRYYGFVSILFQQQRRWATSADPMGEVAKLARIGGLSQEKFDACLANEAYAQGVLLSYQQGETEFGVKSTPSFIVNGRLVSGEMTLEEFQKVVDPLIN
jgi:protein-disulfide isomerase